jgi:murein L,D-transpeptidase YcbB/YkuD
VIAGPFTEDAERGFAIMRRMHLLAVSWAALAVMAPQAFATEPAPAAQAPAPASTGTEAAPVPSLDASAAAHSNTSASTGLPVETGSIDHPDAAIGAAARKLLGGDDAEPGTHLLPAEAAAEADATKTSAEAATPPPKPSPEDLDRTALAEFYQARGDEPLWVTSEGYTPKARLAIAELKRAGDFGLDPEAFAVPELAAGTSPSPDALAEAESSLALAVMAYARHARGGSIPQPAKQLSSYFDRRPQYRDRAALLADLAASSDPASVLTGLHPKHPQFELLRQAWLETRRSIKAKSARMPAGDALTPGQTHADVAILRKRLDVPAEVGSDPLRYDARLAAALQGFQSLKGIAPADGALTKETRAKLNQPIKGKTDQLAANLHMWRYIPEELGDMYVMLNVPEYMVRIIKNGDKAFEERVTVGLVNKQTPIFSDKMELVTFKSRWRVPDSIKVREIWPSLLKGGGMMRQHKLEMRRLHTNELVDWTKIDWSKTPMNDYAIWQPPGSFNQLGIVKFSFPNKHYVFMHDTPDKHMFNWSRRANSHGCMRIRNPLKMAEVILAADKGWDRARIDDLVKNGPDHNIIELDTKIPVHITYFTARIGEGGKIETWGDIYGHEKRFTQALKGQWDRIAVGPDHLAPVDETTPPRVAGRKAPKSNDKGRTVQSIVQNALGGGF